jgi:DNA replication protein DnaC
MELASCDFVGRAEDVILAGPIGTGKSHVAIAMGVEATRRRLRVHFARAADLVQSLVEARDERRLTALQQRYQKVAPLRSLMSWASCLSSAPAASCSSGFRTSRRIARN